MLFTCMALLEFCSPEFRWAFMCRLLVQKSSVGHVAEPTMINERYPDDNAFLLGLSCRPG